MDRIHQVPVPERFLPLINRTLADAYEAESTTEFRSSNASKVAPQLDPSEGPTEIWMDEEVAHAYRESTPAQRTALNYLAARPDEWVTTIELAHELYPNDSDVDARNKLYGVFGAMGRRFHSKYGKTKWFFDVDRERKTDGTSGRMVYCMPSEKAVWVRKASGREQPQHILSGAAGNPT